MTQEVIKPLPSFGESSAQSALTSSLLVSTLRAVNKEGFAFVLMLYALTKKQQRVHQVCNTSRSPGHSLVIQYTFLSSPSANRQGLRGVRESEGRRHLVQR